MRTRTRSSSSRSPCASPRSTTCATSSAASSQDGYQIDNVVTHLSAIGCYFFDPEGNRTEVFWLTGRPSWVMIGVPIDIDRAEDEILAQIDHVWEQTRHVAMGTPPDAAAVAAMQQAYRDAAPVGAR